MAGTALALSALAGGCVQAEGGLCEEAAAHVAECTGDYPDPGQCSPESAELILSMTCVELVEQEEGKADRLGIGDGCNHFEWLPWCRGESDALDEALAEAERADVPADIGRCFDEASIDELYSSAGGKADWFIDIEDALDVTLEKLSFLLLGIVSNFPNEGGAIAETCNEVYPDDVAARIACASRGAERYLDVRIEERDQGGSFMDQLLGINCKHFAWALVELGYDLDLSGWLPVRLRSLSLEAWGHVLNRVPLEGRDGETYEYAVDVGWYPGWLFPLNEAACDWHREHGSELPPFRE